jgi:fructose-bisphosphate aldolase class II
MLRNYKVIDLKSILIPAQRDGYAVGSFSPRCLPMIHPILRAAQKLGSPVIIQISQKELDRYCVTLEEFSKTFYDELERLEINAPTVLHLDHTSNIATIIKAIEARFTSVMIDASNYPLQENIRITKSVVDLAHQQGVSVEGELGRIQSADSKETTSDEALLTDPQEAEIFVRETQVDALAVSVGTFHGIYPVKKPRVDLERLTKIRNNVSVPLVLHGGSGVPAEQIKAAIHLPDGGISKVNIATDLEMAAMEAIGRDSALTSPEMGTLQKEKLTMAQAAVENVVTDRILNYLGSDRRSSYGY